MKVALLFALLVGASATVFAQSQTIYRCGSGGRVLQQHPCDSAAPPAGPSTATEPDERAAAERIRRLQTTADRMERDRLAREARDLHANARAAGIDSRPAAHDAGVPPPKKARPRKLRSTEASKQRAAAAPAH